MSNPLAATYFSNARAEPPREIEAEKQLANNIAGHWQSPTRYQDQSGRTIETAEVAQDHALVDTMGKKEEQAEKALQERLA